MKKIFVFLLLLIYSSTANAQLFKVKSGADHPYKHKVSDLRSTNSAADGQCATYDSATGTITWDTCGSGSGSGDSTASGWTDVSTRVQLVTSTDNVSIGAATTAGKLTIFGDTNEKQLQIKSNATQTAANSSFETSAGQNIFQIADTGLLANVTFTGTTFVGALTGNASTSTALAANGANCSTATEFAVGVDASGVAECEAIADADVPNTITVDNATTATALAADGANCSAGSYPLGVDASGAVQDCTVASTGGSADTIAYHKITPPLTSHGIGFGAFNNTWTSTTGTHVFTAAATTGEFFTVANSGVLASGGALLRLNQSKAANPSGGSIISIENYDTDVAHVTAPNFTVSQAGLLSVPTVTLTGTGTLNGLDSIDSTTETTLEGAIDIAGDVSGTGLTAVAIGADKVTEAMLKAVDSASDEDLLTYETTTGDFEWHTCAEITGSADLCDGSDATGAGAGGATTINTVGDAEADGAIYMGAFSNVWTSTTGSHIWTAASTGGEYFKIVNSGAMAADTGIMKLINTGNAVNGSVLEIVNTDTDMRSIKAPNFTVSQSGYITAANQTLSGDLTVSGDNIRMGTNTLGYILIANGTNFSPVEMIGDCTISWDGIITCTGGAADSLAYSRITPPLTSHGIGFAGFTNTWTSTVGNATFFTIDGSGTDTVFQGDGDLIVGSDITVSGDDIVMATNTSGMALIADGTNFNPVAITGDAVISSTGVVAIQANSVALGTDTVGDYALSNAEGGQALGMDYNYLKSPTGNSGVSFAAFNNTWTATTGAHLWTSANTAGDAFKMVNSGAMGTNTSILKLANTGSVTGGSVLQIENTDTDMNMLKMPNLIVRQAGNTTIGSLGAVNLAKLGVDGDTDENQLVIQGHSTQTSDIVVVENSAGTNLWTSSANGTGFSTQVTVNGGGAFAIISTVNSSGWSAVDGADNTACTSQCTYAAAFGVLNATGTAVTGFVNPDDATADSCICMGPN